MLVKEVTGNIGWRKTLAVTPLIVQENLLEAFSSLSFSIWQEKQEGETVSGTTGSKPVTRNESAMPRVVSELHRRGVDDYH